MIKVDIIMNDNTMLNQVNLYKDKNLGDSQISSESEAIEYLHSDKIVFFGGKYVQGELIANQILHYHIYKDDDDFKTRINNFIDNTKSIYDKTDIADFIIDYRDELFKILK